MFPLMAVDFIFTISPLFNESRIVQSLLRTSFKL